VVQEPTNTAASAASVSGVVAPAGNVPPEMVHREANLADLQHREPNLEGESQRASGAPVRGGDFEEGTRIGKIVAEGTDVDHPGGKPPDMQQPETGEAPRAIEANDTVPAREIRPSEIGRSDVPTIVLRKPNLDATAGRGVTPLPEYAQSVSSRTGRNIDVPETETASPLEAGHPRAQVHRAEIGPSADRPEVPSSLQEASHVPSVPSLEVNSAEKSQHAAAEVWAPNPVDHPPVEHPPKEQSKDPVGTPVTGLVHRKANFDQSRQDEGKPTQAEPPAQQSHPAMAEGQAAGVSKIQAAIDAPRSAVQSRLEEDASLGQIADVAASSAGLATAGIPTQRALTSEMVHRQADVPSPALPMVREAAGLPMDRGEPPSELVHRHASVPPSSTGAPTSSSPSLVNRDFRPPAPQIVAEAGAVPMDREPVTQRVHRQASVQPSFTGIEAPSAAPSSASPVLPSPTSQIMREPADLATDRGELASTIVHRRAVAPSSAAGIETSSSAPSSASPVLPSPASQITREPAELATDRGELASTLVHRRAVAPSSEIGIETSSSAPSSADKVLPSPASQVMREARSRLMHRQPSFPSPTSQVIGEAAGLPTDREPASEPVHGQAGVTSPASQVVTEATGLPTTPETASAMVHRQTAIPLQSAETERNASSPDVSLQARRATPEPAPDPKPRLETHARPTNSQPRVHRKRGFEGEASRSASVVAFPQEAPRRGPAIIDRKPFPGSAASQAQVNQFPSGFSYRFDPNPGQMVQLAPAPASSQPAAPSMGSVPAPAASSSSVGPSNGYSPGPSSGSAAGMSELQVKQLADRVYSLLVRRLTSERDRRGIGGSDGL
jgi:hypothetical protein